MTVLEEKLNYHFTDRTLLLNALTHSSYAHENRTSGALSNERMEFLGDSVLGMLVARHLYKTCPDMPEGDMTRLRAELVCEYSLASVAAELELGKYLRLGRGEEHSGGRSRRSILADAVEAVLAAMYLDGGFAVAQAFVQRYILSKMGAGRESLIGDFKTQLQELVQQHSGQALSYTLLSESGPDHNKVFTAQVSLNGEALGQGCGHTKKEAEQAAARQALAGMQM